MRGERFTKDLKEEARVLKLVGDYESASRYELHQLAHKMLEQEQCDECRYEDPPEHTSEKLRIEVLRAVPGYLLRAQGRIAALRERDRDARELMFKAKKVLDKLAKETGNFEAEDVLSRLNVFLQLPAVG